MITRDRLWKWGAKLDLEHATPVILVGVGHDQNSGQTVVCIPEDVTDEQLCGFLRAVLKELEGKVADSRIHWG